MSSVSALNTSSWLTQTAGVQGGGSSQGSTPAMDAFAALFAQTLALQNQALTTDPTGTAGSTQGSATGVQAVATSGQSSVASDLNALGQALASNNLASAQQAFQSLQGDLQGAQQTHHHPHLGESGQDSQNAYTQTGTAVQTAAISQDLGGSTADSQMLGLLLGRQ